MKKEILITLCCASLILVTPLTGVAQESTVSSNLPEQPNDVDDDCDICPAISVISKLVNEEKYQELSDRLETLKEMNVKTESYSPDCRE